MDLVERQDEKTPSALPLSSQPQNTHERKRSSIMTSGALDFMRSDTGKEQGGLLP